MIRARALGLPGEGKAGTARPRLEATVGRLLVAAAAENASESAKSALLQAGDLERCLAWAWLSLLDSNAESER